MRYFGLYFLCLMSLAASAQEASDFAKGLQPFFEDYCYDCHDDLTTKGDLNLLDLDSDLTLPAGMEIWMRIFDRVTAGECHLKKSPDPERKILTPLSKHWSLR